jgi:hypothetical protein
MNTNGALGLYENGFSSLAKRLTESEGIPFFLRSVIPFKLPFQIKFRSKIAAVLN